jgi:hypothetical protein
VAETNRKKNQTPNTQTPNEKGDPKTKSKRSPTLKQEKCEELRPACLKQRTDIEEAGRFGEGRLMD